jgi:hypothetical protein
VRTRFIVSICDVKDSSSLEVDDLIGPITQRRYSRRVWNEGPTGSVVVRNLKNDRCAVGVNVKYSIARCDVGHILTGYEGDC